MTGPSSRWSKLYPELRFLESQADVRELNRRYRSQLKFRIGMPIIVTLLLAGASGLVLAKWLRTFDLPFWLEMSINASFWALVGAMGGVYFGHRPYVRFVRQELQDRGVAVCLKCGYDLRGQIEPRCPECRQPFNPRLLGTTSPGASCK